MTVDVFFTPAEVDPLAVTDATVVVIDVIRATSTIVEALANGARAVYPTGSTEDALRLAGSLGRDDTLLCGERRGLKIEGFDLGNSPAEFAPDVVDGKRLVMTTTNGTRALLAAAGARRTVTASFLNLTSTIQAVGNTERLAVICAGRSDRFSLEDALCAGMLLEGVCEGRQDSQVLNDAARVALLLAGAFAVDEGFLAETAGGAALIEAGLGDDLAFCARRDLHSSVPEMNDRIITLGVPAS